MSECKIWSMTADRQFTGRCAMRLKAETANNSHNCAVCAVPEEVICTEFGTATYRWDYTPESYWSVLGWVLETDECSCAGRPVPPSVPGNELGETVITPCVRL